MTSKQIKTPSIRFTEYNEDWEQCKLGELGEFKNGMNFSKDAMGHGFPFVNLQNIFGRNEIDINNLGMAEASAKQLNDYNLLEGDVLFVRSSVKLEGVGEAAIVPKTLDNTTYSGFIIRFRDTFGIDKEFKKYIFSTKSVRSQIMSQATDSANKNISQPVLENIRFLMPKNREQVQVGHFFTNLDNLITLHQCKYDKYVVFKKSIVDKMFLKDGADVPEIRFSGFNEKWQQRKLGEISEKNTVKNKDNKYSETLTNSAEHGIISQRDYFDKDISNGKNLHGYYIVHDDDFVYNPRISRLAPVGPIKRNKLGRTGVMSPLYYVFRTHDIDNSFLEYYFEASNWHKFMRFNGDTGARADRFAIKDSVFREMPIPYPSIEEQKLIGQFLNSLTQFIDLHKIELDWLKKLKKTLLKQMFV